MLHFERNRNFDSPSFRKFLVMFYSVFLVGAALAWPILAFRHGISAATHILLTGGAVWLIAWSFICLLVWTIKIGILSFVLYLLLLPVAAPLLFFLGVVALGPYAIGEGLIPRVHPPKESSLIALSYALAGGTTLILTVILPDLRLAMTA